MHTAHPAAPPRPPAWLLVILLCWWAAPLWAESLSVRLSPGPPLSAQVLAAGRALGPLLTYPCPGKMASVADVDGDGRPDLLVLVYKPTRFDPRPGWRPFVFTLREGRWRPKWLGSRVGRPLQEAAWARTTQGVRLMTVERFAPGRVVLTRYHWRGFGFWGEWTSDPLPWHHGLQVADRDGDGADELSLLDPAGRRQRFGLVGEQYILLREGSDGT